ncbi:MAG: hypothetical protein AAGA10_29600 [Bacteroidota bacterium]
MKRICTSLFLFAEFFTTGAQTTLWVDFSKPAYKLYGDMPVERKEFEVENGSGGLNGFASANESRAGSITWNNSDSLWKLQLYALNLPFDEGKVRLYRIYEQHSSYQEKSQDDTLAIESQSSIHLYGVK